MSTDPHKDYVALTHEGSPGPAEVNKHNCRNTLAQHADRVSHFKRRAQELGLTADAVVVAVVSVDDPNGNSLAEALMPGHDWQAYRDRGEKPFANGLVERPGIERFLDKVDAAAAEKLKAATELSVVVIDYGVAEVFTAHAV